MIIKKSKELEGSRTFFTAIDVIDKITGVNANTFNKKGDFFQHTTENIIIPPLLKN